MSIETYNINRVNFAFAYVDPESYKIVTMDAQTPSSLFKDTANLKSIKPSLQVFISVGGWYDHYASMPCEKKSK